jgi:uncharacterized membrane protein
VDFHRLMELVVIVFEVVGVAVFAVGSMAAGIRAALRWTRGERAGNYEQVRREIGKSILLGLEILIIADIVHTIIVDLSLDSALILAVIVLVRTFLSFSLEVELEGAFPWRLAALRAAKTAAAGAEPSGDSAS